MGLKVAELHVLLGDGLLHVDIVALVSGHDTLGKLFDVLMLMLMLLGFLLMGGYLALHGLDVMLALLAVTGSLFVNLTGPLLVLNGFMMLCASLVVLLLALMLEALVVLLCLLDDVAQLHVL